jgi:mannitol/fructose-specific phosphotransferase system IIA component
MRDSLVEREQRIQMLAGRVVSLEIGVEKYRKNIDKTKLDLVKSFEWTS